MKQLPTLILGLIVATACLSGVSLAQDTPPPGSVSVAAISYSGTGCNPNSVAMDIAQDAQAFTVLFDSYVADSAGATARRIQNQATDEKTCVLNVQLNIPSGWSFSLLGLMVRGFAHLDDQSTGQNSLAFRVPGIQQERQVDSVNLRGPYIDDYLGQSLFTLNNLAWTPCTAGTQPVFLRTRLTAHSRQGGQALMTVDSVDGALEHTYGIAWRHCTDNVNHPHVQQRIRNQMEHFKSRRDRPHHHDGHGGGGGHHDGHSGNPGGGHHS